MSLEDCLGRQRNAARQWSQFAAASRSSIRTSRRWWKDCSRRGNRLHLHQCHVHAQENARMVASNTERRCQKAGRSGREDQGLQSKNLISKKTAAEVRKRPERSSEADRFRRSKMGMYWNVHLDGLERTHDLIVEREGVFKECVLAIKMAKVLDTRSRQHDRSLLWKPICRRSKMMFDIFRSGVDGHTITPVYDYDAAKKT